MNKDILCSEVVGLVGEPFEIKTTSQFDKATLTYVIDKSKLGDTEFDNLLFLWYDEEIQEYKIDDLLMRKKKPQGCQGCSKGCNNKNQGCNKGHGKRKN